jgi:hypothetical protein
MGLGGSKARKRTFAENELTAVGALYPGDNLHQRRFSGAVAAHQRAHLAGNQREINLLQHSHAGELFADLASFKQRLHHRASF